MLEAAETAGVKHMVGFNYRFTPAVILAKKLIEEGRLGEIYHFRCMVFTRLDYRSRPSPCMEASKRDCWLRCHGDLGAHLIDMAHYLDRRHIRSDWYE